MNLKQGFAKALRKARKAKGLSQEDFSDVSSRTYVSTLERGLYTPTLEKVEALAKTIGVHPLTLVAMACLEADHKIDLDKLIAVLRQEVQE
jgi:transcriptional regulator with XRE-family HTH domain